MLLGRFCHMLLICKIFLMYYRPERRSQKGSERDPFIQGRRQRLREGGFDSPCTRWVGWAAWDTLKPWVGD